MSKKFARSSMYFDLIEACREPGCPVCRLGLCVARRDIDFVLHERVNDPDTHAELCASRGYCNRHAWMMADRHVRSLGVAMLEGIVIREVLEVLAGAGYDQGAFAVLVDDGHRGVVQAMQRLLQVRLEFRGPSPRAMQLAGMLEAQVACPICDQQATTEASALAGLLNDLGDEAMLRTFQASDGLCLPHFRQALAQGGEDAAITRLVDLQRAHFERLRAELSEFIDKTAYHVTAESLGAERDSWLRAIGALSGQRGAR
jgi:hypothetical protein